VLAWLLVFISNGGVLRPPPPWPRPAGRGHGGGA